MHSPIHPSIHLPIILPQTSFPLMVYLSIHLLSSLIYSFLSFNHLTAHLLIHLSSHSLVHLSICSSIQSFIHPPIHPPIYLSIHPSTYPSIYPPTCPPTHLVIYLLIHPSICHSTVISWSMPRQVHSYRRSCRRDPSSQGTHSQEITSPQAPPFTKGLILTSLSQLNISGRMGLASTVQTMSTEPPIFTSVGSWRARMMGASREGRSLGKALGPRQAMVEEGPRWVRRLRGARESHGWDKVCL